MGIGKGLKLLYIKGIYWFGGIRKGLSESLITRVEQGRIKRVKRAGQE